MYELQTQDKNFNSIRISWNVNFMQMYSTDFNSLSSWLWYLD